MPSEPLIALALSLLISLAPFLPAAEKSAPEEEPARVVEEQPALSGGGNVYGSYVHGIFDAPGIADTILRALCARKGVSFDALATFDARGYKERQYDLLADVVRGGLDMSFVYRVLRREV